MIIDVADVDGLALPMVLVRVCMGDQRNDSKASFGLTLEIPVRYPRFCWEFWLLISNFNFDILSEMLPRRVYGVIDSSPVPASKRPVCPPPRASPHVRSWLGECVRVSFV